MMLVPQCVCAWALTRNCRLPACPQGCGVVTYSRREEADAAMRALGAHPCQRACLSALPACLPCGFDLPLASRLDISR
jgi:hypothetical protein